MKTAKWLLLVLCFFMLMKTQRKQCPFIAIMNQYSSSNHCFQNRTEPGGRIVKTRNWDENRFFKPKEPDFLLIS